MLHVVTHRTTTDEMRNMIIIRRRAVPTMAAPTNTGREREVIVSGRKERIPLLPPPLLSSVGGEGVAMGCDDVDSGGV